MNAAHVGLTFGKELREALRDRRTLAVMILLPLVVYPLLAMLVAQVAMGREQQREERPSAVAIVGDAAGRPALEAEVRKRTDLFVLAPVGAPDDIKAGRLDALAQLGGENAKLTVLFDATRDQSRLAEERLSDVMAHVLPEGCAPKFTLERRSLAPKAQLGGYVLSKALPLFVVLMVLLGAFYPAIDVTAGERERGTLETVLCSPIRRADLMLGKVLAVAALASLTGALNLASMAATLMQVLRLTSHAIGLDVPWAAALASSLVILPAALLFAGVFVALGATARTFKEAQTLLMPVYFLTIAPALAGAIGEYRLEGLAAWIPGMNLTLLARDLLVGRATWVGAGATLASTVLLVAVALGAAARIYDSERLVAQPRVRRRQPGPAPTTSAGDALALFALAFLLLYFVFLPLEQRHLAAGLLVAEWLGLFGLVALYARLSGQRLGPVLGAVRPHPLALGGAALVGCGAWAAVATISERVLPAPRHLVEALRHSLVWGEGSRGYLATLLVMAVSPAVCEEALFRGPILRGLRTRMSSAAAIVVTGLLFGLFHLDVYRLLPASLLGILLGIITLESGSIVPAMLAHFCNNAILVTFARSGFDRLIEGLSHRGETLLVMGSVLLTAAGFYLVHRARPTREV